MMTREHEQRYGDAPHARLRETDAAWRGIVSAQRRRLRSPSIA
jgi:hypothetical protein